MSRITDPMKIERIKQAAAELIIENGYIGTSIAQIAKRAQVSTGYLYRHYASKDELVEDILNANFRIYESFLNRISQMDDTLQNKIALFIQLMADMAKDEPLKLKLAKILVNELGKSYTCEYSSFDIMLFGFFQELVSTAKIRGELKESFDEFELFYIMVNMPLNYIAGLFTMGEVELEDKRINNLIDICVASVK